MHFNTVSRYVIAHHTQVDYTYEHYYFHWPIYIYTYVYVHVRITVCMWKCRQQSHLDWPRLQCVIIMRSVLHYYHMLNIHHMGRIWQGSAYITATHSLIVFPSAQAYGKTSVRYRRFGKHAWNDQWRVLDFIHLDLRYICWCPETDLAIASGSDKRFRIVAFSKMVFNACLPYSFFPQLRLQPLYMFSMVQVSSHSMPLCVHIPTEHTPWHSYLTSHGLFQGFAN